MLNKKIISTLLNGFKLYIEPFTLDLEKTDKIEYLLYKYGWNVEIEDAALKEIIFAILGDNKVALLDLIDQINNWEYNLGFKGVEFSESDAKFFFDSIRNFYKSLTSFQSVNIEHLPAPFNSYYIWEDFLSYLLLDLLDQYLKKHHPFLYSFLIIFGIISIEDVYPVENFRIKHSRVQINTSQVILFFKNPLLAFSNKYYKNELHPAFNVEAFLSDLRMALRLLRVSADYVFFENFNFVEEGSSYLINSDARMLKIPVLYKILRKDFVICDIYFLLFPIIDRNDATHLGILVRPVIRGNQTQSFLLTEELKLSWDIKTNINELFSVILFPRRTEIDSKLPLIDFNLSLISLKSSPYIIVGNLGTSRLELHGFEFYFQASGQVSDPEVKIGMRTLAPNGEGKGMKAVVVLEESDSFLRETTQNEQLEASFDVLMEWSNKTGFRINGSLNFDLNFDLNQKLGPVEITGLSVGLGEGPKRTSQKSTSLRTGLGLKGKLGPVQFEVERMGFALDFIPYTQSDLKALPPDADRPLLGLLDLDYHFLPPKGLALTINAKSVKGGGFLRFDPDNGQYDGVLQLEIGGRIGLNAIGLLQTRLPDGKKGYSFLIIITASGFTPIQLGFGFLLTKVGGLLGIHRGVDTKQIRDGLKSEGLSNVLFPEDPMANVGGIVSSLRTYFPPTQGQYVFGPMGEITWGKPTILRIRLGVLYEFPLANRLHILAQFKAGLPSLDKPLLLLNMDAAGSIDLNSGELAVDAVLYKSNLLGINLSGGMAMRLRGGNDPLFLLSVGGFNPRFKAPPGFPKVDRISLGLAKENDEPPPVGTYPSAETKKPGTRLELQAYFALTSNTVQFGAHLDLYVSAWTFSIEGYLYFDALFQFSPFQFVVDFSGGVCVKWFGYTLFELRLDITLSGPTPWHAKGEAHFSICWGVIDITVSFDRDLSEGTPPPLPPAVNPLPELLKALGDARNWEGEWPENGRSFVSLREIQVESDSVLVHPEVGLRVRQRVLPLGQKLSRVGNNRLAVETQFDIKGLFLSDKNKQSDTDGEQPVKDVEDYFAMAQYLDGMSEHEKLSRPSFEKQKAGVAMAASSAIFDEELAIGEDIGFQTWRVLEDTGALQTDGDESRISGEDLAAQARFGAAGQALMRRSLKAQLF